MSALADQPARQLAATCFDQNVVVVAGAGSGKTTLLIERLLNLILGRGVRLPAIVALTFTEKAAAEMRARLAGQISRVLQLLAGAERGQDAASFSLAWVMARDAGAPGASAAEVRARALQALDDLDGSSIGTIHAFCADLLRRHPVAAGLDPAFDVDDGALTDRALQAEWVTFQATTLRHEAPQAASWKRVLASASADAVLQAARALLDMPRLPDATTGDLPAELMAQARDLRARCEIARTMKISANASDWLVPLGARLDALVTDGVAGLHAHEQRHPAAWPTKAPPKAGRGCENSDLVESAIRDAAKLTDALLATDDATCEALMDLARQLASKTRERLDVEGVVGFSELLVRARDVLLTDRQSRRQVQGRIEAILLDEFQDTDPLQYEIAFLLAEDPGHPVSEGGDPWEARLVPGRLFIVGDPKQSIYRFRGADMAAYERAVGHIVAQGAHRVSLVANFRSCEEVLGPVNDLCEQVITLDPPYQPPYERLVASRDRAVTGETRVELWSVGSDARMDAAAWRLAEGRVIASRVRAWREDGLISDYGQVVILLRAMTGGEAYQRGLGEFGVPFVTQGGRGFFEREEVVQAIALLRCLAHPNDAPSILAVLRSPACGASDAEILRFARLARGEWTLRAAGRLGAAERAEAPLVARALVGLERLAAAAAELPADEAVRLALTEGRASHEDGSPGEAPWRPHLIALHAASRGGAQRVANLEKLVERAQSLARAEGLSLPQIVDRLQADLIAGAKQGESPLADEAMDAVRLMTIHQAKGLEFHTVIVPDIARETPPGQRGVAIAVHGGALAVSLPGAARNAAHVAHAADAERHDAAETQRLLYVALTRASERLVLVNGCTKPKINQPVLQAVMAGWNHDPADATGGPNLHGGVAHAVHEPPEPPDDPGEAPAGADVLARAVRDGESAASLMLAARVGRPGSATGLKEERDARASAESYPFADAGVSQSAESPKERQAGEDSGSRAPRRPRDRSLSRAVGIAVHLALEEGSLDDPRRLLDIGRRAAVLAAGEEGADAAAVAREVLACLEPLAGSDLARALAGARVIAKELPFLLPAHDGRDWQGSVDLVVEKDGATWVVDWKTDREAAPERHAAQLALYAEAVRRWRGLSEPPRTALAYVALGRWVEVGQ